MDQLTKADFIEWANLPMTVQVINHLLEEQQEYSHIDTTLAMKAGHIDDQSIELTLERIGLDSAMRASVTQGLSMVTDLTQLLEDMQAKRLISVPKEQEDE